MVSGVFQLPKANIEINHADDTQRDGPLPFTRANSLRILWRAPSILRIPITLAILLVGAMPINGGADEDWEQSKKAFESGFSGRYNKALDTKTRRDDLDVARESSRSRNHWTSPRYTFLKKSSNWPHRLFRDIHWPSKPDID